MDTHAYLQLSGVSLNTNTKVYIHDIEREDLGKYLFMAALEHIINWYVT